MLFEWLKQIIALQLGLNGQRNQAWSAYKKL